MGGFCWNAVHITTALLVPLLSDLRYSRYFFWSLLCSAWENSVYREPKIQHFQYKNQWRAQILIFHTIFLDLQLLWFCLLEGVIHDHPRPKQMNPNLTNQYCCLDALHLSRCFAEIPRWNSKKEKCTVNTSAMKCGPGCSFVELLWLFAAIELSRGFRVQHTASSPGSFLYNTYKWENKITLDCTAAGCRRKAIK